MAKLLSFVVLVLITGAIGVLFFEVVSAFLLPLFLATVIVVLFRPYHAWCLTISCGRNRVSAVLATISVLLIILLPILIMLAVASNEASRLVQGWDDGEVKVKFQQARVSLGLDFPFAGEFRFIERSIDRLLDDAREGTVADGNRNALLRLNEEWQVLENKLNARDDSLGAERSQSVHVAFIAAGEKAPGTLGYQQAIETASRRFRDYQSEYLGGSWNAMLKDIANPTSEDIAYWMRRLFSISPNWISSVGGKTGGYAVQFLLGLLILVITMYFLFADGPRIAKQLMSLSPMEDHYEEQLMSEFSRVARSVMAGSVASAVAQGILVGIGLWLAGLKSIFLLTSITVLTALVPFVGASIVWLPVSLWLVFINNRPIAGVVFMIYGAAVISTIDNVIRTWMLHGQSAMHPLAALIGILGGVQTLGPLGAFVGPMVVACLQTLLSLIHRELSALDAGHWNRSKPLEPIPKT